MFFTPSLSSRSASPPERAAAELALFVLVALRHAQTHLRRPPSSAGWFSLNVPSGLTLYWFVNNILTTSQTVYLRRFKTPKLEAMAEIPLGTTTIVKEKDETKDKKVKGALRGTREAAARQGSLNLKP